MSIYKTAYPDEPGWKARETSRQAAEGVAPVAGSLRARVFDSLKTAGPGTPEDIAARLGEPVMNIRPRLSELATTKGNRRALIVDTGQRGPAMGGRRAIIWKIA